MTVLPILPEIHKIFEYQKPATWELSFDALEISAHYEGREYHCGHRPSGNLLLHTQPNSKIAQMEVMDHIMFSFTFSWEQPKGTGCYFIPMKNLEKLFSCGILNITPDQLSLTFVIEEKEKALCMRYEYGALWFAERVG
ncbi:hypothetical protein ACOKFD_16910 [Flagellimonas sp. S174]|uniref:hypothetical protein n=1 Tax=Flagellimonas sp. S174 TaxID=3410790 RepID=UPI003BF46B3C